MPLHKLQFMYSAIERQLSHLQYFTVKTMLLWRVLYILASLSTTKVIVRMHPLQQYKDILIFPYPPPYTILADIFIFANSWVLKGIFYWLFSNQKWNRAFLSFQFLLLWIVYLYSLFIFLLGYVFLIDL